MKMRDLVTIETVYKVIEGNYIYRVNVSANGAFIKRTKKLGGTWTHSILTEIWNTDQGKFVPVIQNPNITYVQFRDLEAIINGKVPTDA
jgi:hypothetical protein